MHTPSQICRKFKRIECRFYFDKYFTIRTILAKPLPHDFGYDERFLMFSCCENILLKVRNYINESLYPTCDIDGSCSIAKILSKLGIKDKNYYSALFISNDNNDELHLVQSLNSCIVNNYFNISISVWEANINIQPVQRKKKISF